MCTESGEPSGSRWRGGDVTSRVLCDIIADRNIPARRSLAEDELRLAYSHGLIGILADPERPGSLPQARPVYARLAARQQVMKAHLFKILSRLDETGIPATVVKGPYLAHHVYRREMHRTYTDIDLLVRPGDVTAALEVMAATGFAHVPERRAKAEKRDVIFTDPSGVSFSVDLHWDLFSYRQLRGSAEGAIRWAWDRGDGRFVSPLGPMWSIADEARLAFLCTHALLDHRFRLILFRDLAEVARGRVDWERFIVFAEHWDLRSLTYLALLMAQELAEAPVPGPVLQALRPRNVPIRVAEGLLPRTDLVRFRGDSVHPLNLAIVLTNDRARSRAILAAQAPFAYPGWRKRVEVWRPDGALGANTGSPMQPRPRTALIVLTTDRRRGAEVFGEELARGLESMGWRIEVASLTSEDASEPRVEAMPITGRSPEDVGKLRLDVVLSLRRLIKRARPSIIFANGSATLRYTVASLFGMRRPPRFIYASIGEPLYWIRGPFHRLLSRLLLGRVDHHIAVSEATRRQLVEHFEVDPNQVTVARTGVSPELTSPPFESHPGPLHLLFLGSVSEEKDPYAALEVFRRVAATTSARLRFVGSGALLRRLRQDVGALDIADQVEFTGSVADVAPHLAWADLLLLTSRTEGLPGVVLEAAAAGVPTVAFDVGGTRETMIPERTGAVVDGRDIAGMAELLISLAMDRDRLRSWGEAARDFVQDGFLLDQAVERYHEVFESVGLSNRAVAHR